MITRREQIKGTMLLAMSEHHSGNAEEARKIVDAQLLALEAAGVQMVPSEATEEMQNAAVPLLAEVNSIIVTHAVRTGSDGLKQPVSLAQIYAAMISASPFAPPAKDTRND